MRVEQRLDGSMAVKFRQYDLHGGGVPSCDRKCLHRRNPRARRSLDPRSHSNWMKDFHLHKSSPLRCDSGTGKIGWQARSRVGARRFWAANLRRPTGSSAYPPKNEKRNFLLCSD